MEWRKEGDKMVVRLMRGEKIMATLSEFLDRTGIKGGFIRGTGRPGASVGGPGKAQPESRPRAWHRIEKTTG